MLEDSALDKYTFSRDIFLQLRMNEVEQASGHTTSSDEYLDDLPVQTPLNEMSVPSPVANAARPSQNQNQNAGVADANTTSINNEAINLDSTSKINVVINTQLADSDTEQKQQGVQLPQISASQVQASSN
jgi:hypothetical protein